MEIKKGDWFRCIKSSTSIFTEGDYYTSKRDGYLIANDGQSISKFHSEFKNIYTIQDLKDGKVAVVNDGTVDELDSIIKVSFNSTQMLVGERRFYMKHSHGIKYWNSHDTTDLPTQSVKDFLVQLPKEIIIEDHDTLNTRREKLGYKPVVNTPINPKHYSFSIKGTHCDLFDIGNAMDLNKEQFTALRYFRKKENQIEDTKKAIKCLERLVERLESERND